MMKQLALILVSVAAISLAAADEQTSPSGATLFQKHCGYCHLPGGTGTFMLERRLGKERALLAERRDLPQAYVEHVVRNGLQSMPALTRVEVTDSELTALASWLARNTPQ